MADEALAAAGGSETIAILLIGEKAASPDKLE
jgi:hypothetical protein